MKKMRYLKNVTTLKLDTEKCIGCQTCTQVCPHNVFTMQTKKANIKDQDACMECGACATNCPAEALSVKSGVGCATGIIIGALRGTEPTCGCKENPTSCCA